MNYFFTSDSHFGHSNLIIKHHCRPFSTIEEHDETLIQNYNSIIQPKDIVYCLGDFAWKDPEKYLSKLNGAWILIRGNHDPLNIYNVGFQFVKDVYFIQIHGQYIFMSHFPHRVWNRSHYGTWHLYGHCHNILPDYGRSCDVGVDAWEYKPVSFDQIKERFKNVAPMTHRERKP
jgi:calcineurin-like phosphoesterase family protein